ncbi:Sucrase/ferredoxin-like-domain-containing protein [Collybia nuda]|uniref:Sucrase/ferredoxin-like-domain-containing protein n=1 Tax=Collybia nuda TaxID=64659 RepID=A0A9P6CMS3_9AGAR|nr:Sucrase/ferredoxin-like-domain-containing protein [Collybia nuda]
MLVSVRSVPLTHRPLDIRPFSASLKFARKLTTEPTKNNLEEAKPLYGTVASHRSYIFLHASEPPSEFPARMSTAIQRALMLRTLKWGGIVNFSWHGPKSSSSDDSTSATAFSTAGGRLEIPKISLDNVDEIEVKLRKHSEGPLVKSTDEEIQLYVCTHGARDCRCGDMGSRVVKALREEVQKRLEADPHGIVSRVKVGEVGHVGGHQYAANLLVLPHGEWLGLLTPEDIPTVLDKILAHTPAPFDASQPPLYPERWRGRMGLSKDEQSELYMLHAP